MPSRSRSARSSSVPALAEHLDDALVGEREPFADLDRRRLAGAVRAEKPEALTRGDGEIEAVHGDDVAERFRRPTTRSAGGAAPALIRSTRASSVWMSSEQITGWYRGASARAVSRGRQRAQRLAVEPVAAVGEALAHALLARGEPLAEAGAAAVSIATSASRIAGALSPTMPVQSAGSPPARRVMSRPPGPSAERGTPACAKRERECGGDRLWEMAAPRHLLVVLRRVEHLHASAQRAPERLGELERLWRRARARAEKHASLLEQGGARCAPSRIDGFR